MIDMPGFLAERKQAAHAGLAPGHIARPELDDLHAIARVTGLAVIRAESALWCGSGLGRRVRAAALM
jgi:hypothetical protein